METTPPPLHSIPPYTPPRKPTILDHIKTLLLSVAPFFLKMLLLVVFLLIIVGIIAGLSASIPQGVHVTNLNSSYEKMIKAVHDSIDVPYTASNINHSKNVFVLSFTGDMAASSLGVLSKEISLVLKTATPSDEVIIKVESGGGFVHSYGLAASQLARIKKAGIPLTVVVDKVAASGGYMMACMADTLVVAPFAILGSIGVVAEFPNFSGWMQKQGIGYDQYTAGEHKRTVSPFKKATEKEKVKMREDLEAVHKLFKELVAENRPDLDIKKTATGEIWYGSDALDIGLADTIATSDDILFSRMQKANVYRVKYLPESTFSERMANSAAIFSEKIFFKISEHYINQ